MSKIPRRTKNSLDGLLNMIKYINSITPTKELSILEIGSWVGVSTELFAKHFKYVVACDPYKPTIGINTQYNMREVEKEFDNRMGKYKNVEKKRYTSEEYSKISCDLENGRVEGFDVIYIDGAHDIINVTRDIVLWKDRCKLFFCGHDYHQKKFPGVVRSVNTLLGKPEKTFKDTSWLFRVKGEIR